MTACDVDIEIIAATDHGNVVLNRGDEDYFESTPTHDLEDAGVWIFAQIYQFKLRLGRFSPLIIDIEVSMSMPLIESYQLNQFGSTFSKTELDTENTELSLLCRSGQPECIKLYNYYEPSVFSCHQIESLCMWDANLASL